MAILMFMVGATTTTRYTSPSPLDKIDIIKLYCGGLHCSFLRYLNKKNMYSHIKNAKQVPIAFTLWVRFGPLHLPKFTISKIIVFCFRFFFCK